MGILPILLMIAMLATLLVLVVGLIGFFQGGEFNRKYGNKLMRARGHAPVCRCRALGARVADRRLLRRGCRLSCLKIE